MRILLALIGAAALVGPTHVGSEGFSLDQWRLSWNGTVAPANMPVDVSVPALTSAAFAPAVAPAPFVRLVNLEEDVSFAGNTRSGDTFRTPQAETPEPDSEPEQAEAVDAEEIEVAVTVTRSFKPTPYSEYFRREPTDVPLDVVCRAVAAAAEENDLPAGFFARLIWQESRFNQRVVSRAGAQGVAQFMPKVAVWRGLKDPFDPLEALPHSARFLKEHVDYFGNLGLAAAAYNAGPRRVTDWMARRGKLPEETRNYVKIITGHAPEKWLQNAKLELPVYLPERAPCEGVADLSRTADPATIHVRLGPQVAKLVVNARVASAKKSNRSHLAARNKGGANKKLASNQRKSGSKAKARVRLADGR